MSTEPEDTHDEDTAVGSAAAAAATTDNDNKIQLGFSVEFEDEGHRRSVGHRSPYWVDWDGGQIGGRPSWLNPRDIPYRPIECQLCKTPMVFVCQLYAPLEIELNPNAFHRSFYVFACPNTGSSTIDDEGDDGDDDGNCEGDKCSMATTGTVRVLRTQLPKKNPFYPERIDEGNDDDNNHHVDDLESSSSWTKHRPETWGVRLCVASGQRGHGKCPIQRLEFCSKYHQKEYKKYIYDKVKIKDNSDNDDDDDLQAIDLTKMPSMMANSELVVEEEPDYDTNDSSKSKSALFQPSTNGGGGDGDDGEDDENLEQSDLNAITGAAPETVTKDEVTMQFYDRINSLDNVKSQCLRYLRWPDLKVCEQTNTPLWIRSDFQPPPSTSSENTIPPCCDKCGAPRKFEFQLMPQMIHYLLSKNKKNQQQQQNESKTAGYSTTAKQGDGNVTDSAAIDALRTATAIMDETPPEQIPPDLADTTEKAAATMRKKLMGGSTRSSSTPGWGVVAVYTCTKSCGGDDILDVDGDGDWSTKQQKDVDDDDDDLGAYIEEFAWRQPSLD
mmetsp:Transcript_18424/g.44501  ORF Transcript_18424/g.44501 Transcript_18424/m.44501 type:complete len:555 (+) Transcript_18424:121-1785(+)